MYKVYNNLDTVIIIMFEKIIYNIVSSTGFVVFQFLYCYLTSSKENDRLIVSFSGAVTKLYSGGAVTENRGSLFISSKNNQQNQKILQH